VPTIYRQRYECTCGFHGAREAEVPPLHIKCPRCAGVAIARGAAEQVQPTETTDDKSDRNHQ